MSTHLWGKHFPVTFLSAPQFTRHESSSQGSLRLVGQELEKLPSVTLRHDHLPVEALQRAPSPKRTEKPLRTRVHHSAEPRNVELIFSLNDLHDVQHVFASQCDHFL